MHDIYTPLQKYFGYSTFRPLQKEIIQNILDKKDTFVLMPTGGGKSLCYQLPSVVQQGVTVVVSPLISLMKDQVDSLRLNGIQAAYLNSSLNNQEQQFVIEQLKQNKLSLLYVAPERLVQPNFLEFIKTLPVNFFTIDESHCISQWGHDFRPEYRQLNILKREFPGTPVIALTATATPRVKDDIINHLQLQNANIYQASFNRPNLSYYVYSKQNAFEQTVEYIQKHNKESGIIYCQSRKTVESLAAGLQAEGIQALPYHAGLHTDVRKKNQEDFIRDDVSIIVATIAFGMGINKSNVRYVIHYDLPKTLENYYQETGRAGRDGLPSECVFLYSYGDTFFYERFIKEKQSEEEQHIARTQLHTVINYAQSTVCRRKQLLNYFAEHYDENSCGSCDNCLFPQETFDATILSQKILSCIYRTNERFGALHIINILTGSKVQKVLANNHHKLSTYNIVSDYAPVQLRSCIYELLQLGFIEQSQDQYAVLRLTGKGKRLLKGLEKVSLTKPKEIKTKAAKIPQDLPIDQQLFDKLRALRKKLADTANLPPYIIFPDKSLYEMAGYYPQTIEQFATMHGVGKEKLRNYAEVFLKEIAVYCKEHDIQPKQKYSQKTIRKLPSNTNHITETLQLYKAGKTIKEIAQIRGYTVGTIHTHLQKAYMQEENINIDALIPISRQKVIEQAFQEANSTFLAPVKQKLGEEYSYEEIRWVQAKLMREGKEQK